MALLLIEESKGKKSILRIILSTTVLINCICSAQTNKHKREDEKEGGRVGAEEDVRVEPLTTRNVFTHVEVAR
jgi:hypothetical protein